MSAPEHSLAESATKLQQASEAMAVTMDDLSESLAQVADGFELVSETTRNPPQPEPTVQTNPAPAHTSGFAAADD